MTEVNDQMSAYYNAVMNLSGLSEEDGVSKGISPNKLTMKNINAGVTIPFYGDIDGENKLSTLCMSCVTRKATTRLHKNCHVVHEHLELTLKAVVELEFLKVPLHFVSFISKSAACHPHLPVKRTKLIKIVIYTTTPIIKSTNN